MWVAHWLEFDIRQGEGEKFSIGKNLDMQAGNMLPYPQWGAHSGGMEK